MRRIEVLFMTIISAALLRSCDVVDNVVKKVKTAQSINPAIYEFTDGQKLVRFIEALPVARLAFYEKVRDEIELAKSEGFILIYGGMRTGYQTDEVKLKARRILGYFPNKEGYKNQDLDEFQVAMDREMFLGQVNEKDYNVDITLEQLVSEYENKFGEIKLTSDDYDTPLSEEVVAAPFFKVNKIVKDYRNEKVSNYILNAYYDKKIIAVYDMSQRKAIFENLQRSDMSWKQTKYSELPTD